MMRKLPFLAAFFCLLFASPSSAQLNPGDTAPDWTMTDINGNTYHLYEILDQGKNVIIDFSATWCPPCWSFHNSGILEHLYETYGPDGTDELMVFFVEGDVTTTSADLHGTGNRTQGDWVTGTPYPIFDITSQQILIDYKLPYWPTVYTICNDRKIKVEGRFSVAGFESQLSSCPTPVPPLELTNTEITNATCSSSEDGAIVLTIEGTNPPYTVYWSDGSNSNGTLENIGPGTYNASIIDNNGNFLEVGPFQVGYDTEGVTATIVNTTNASCNNGLGSIDINITAGNAESFLWSNGATTEDVNNLTPGVYSVSITGTGGCEVSLDGIEIAGANVPSIDLNTTSQLVCNAAFIELDASNSVVQDGDEIIWTTQDGNIIANENTLTPQVDHKGTYTLTITNQEGCSAQSSIFIAEPDYPTAHIADVESLDCNTSCLVLDATNSTIGDNSDFQWTTPDGSFSDGIATMTPTICQQGTYTLIVTNTENGCTAIAEVIVNQNVTVPESSIDGNTELNCNTASLTLSTNQNEQNTYTWTDANENEISSENSIIISEAGNYNLLVTDNTNGCTSTSSVDITENTLMPSIASLSASNDITCAQNSATITAQVENNNQAIFHWTLPSGETMDTDIPSLDISSPGTYQLVVENENGCTTNSEIEVVGSSDTPQALASSGTISCQNTEVVLSGNSNLDDVTFQWSGPNGFSSNEQNPVVSTVGEYTLTVQSSNGCKSSTTTVVAGNTEMPQLTNIHGFSNCNEYGLSVEAVGTNLTYQWSGPNGFSSNEQNPNIEASIEGEFTCVVTNEYGCSIVAKTNIEDQSDFPTIVSASGLINCNQSALSIEMDGDAANYTYQWSGPNGFSSNAQNPEISENAQGNYTCVVTSSTGCTAMTNTDIVIDNESPNIQVTASNEINCIETEATLSISNNENNLTYQWSGPNGFSANESVTTIHEGGNYTVIATNDENGCTSTENISVEAHTQGETVQLENTTINCDNTSIQLPENIQNQDVNWSDSDGNTISNTVSQDGIYTGVFTDNYGCDGKATIAVIADKNKPEFTINDTQITCEEGEATLSIDAQSAVRSVAWAGPGITPANKYQTNPKVSIGGLYIADVTGENGCNDSKDKEIKAEPPLNIEVKSIQNISCHGEADGHVELDIITGTPPLSYDFDVTNPLAKGTYFIHATDDNGCKNEFSFMIMEPASISISFDEVTPYSESQAGQAKAVATGGTPPFTYLWEDGSTDQKNTSLSVGLHSVTITDANACTQESSVTIEQSTGIVEIDGLQNFEISPNPNNGLFKINLEFQTNTNFKMDIISILGKHVFSNSFSNQRKINQSLDLTHLQSGAYILKITTDSGQQAIQKINILK